MHDLTLLAEYMDIILQILGLCAKASHKLVLERPSYEQAFKNGNEVEVVRDFIYLRSEFNANGAWGNEIRR